MKKRVVVLGSTGSIGVNTLKVLENLHAEFELVGLITNSNASLLKEQIQKFKPKFACLIDETQTKSFPEITETKMYFGRQSAIDLCGSENYEILVSSLVGFAGLEPTISAIKSGKNIALANKETLIVAGHIITDLVHRHNVTLKPIDSEHSAIFQCLVGEPPDSIEKVVLTASGGPFLNRDAASFSSITVADALKHPNWVMGKKITIDSATLMNKGLEVIEAKWLFDLKPEQVDVVVHPQSIIHSMVQFTDGSIKAQLGVPDMKVPIQYALTHPTRSFAPYERLNFSSLKALTFFEPDFHRFPCLRIAFESMKKGGSFPCVMNAANEIAVDLFLNEKIGFMQIPQLIEEVIQEIPFHPYPELGDILELDRQSRIQSEKIFKKLESVML